MSFFSKWWVLLIVGALAGIFASIMVLGLTGGQFLSAFKGRYLSKAA